MKWYTVEVSESLVFLRVFLVGVEAAKTFMRLGLAKTVFFLKATAPTGCPERDLLNHRTVRSPCAGTVSTEPGSSEPPLIGGVHRRRLSWPESDHVFTRNRAIGSSLLRLVSIAGSKPTGFQPFGFEQPVPIPENGRNGGIQAKRARGVRPEVPHDLVH